MKKFCVSLVTVAFVLLSAVALAERRPHEGKITNIDMTAKVVAVQEENGDQITLTWDETTKFKDNLTAQELRVGDSIHFDFVDKQGQKFATEIHRTHKAKS